MPYRPEQVYTSENFYFATQAAGRPPTLYFRTNHGSGRLRQQHDDGPLVQEIRKHTSHAFFAREKQLDAIEDEIDELFDQDRTMTRQQFRELRRKHHGTNRPVQGYYHYEATFDGHAEGRVCNNRHASSGTIVPPSRHAELKAQVPEIFAQTRAEKIKWDAAKSK